MIRITFVVFKIVPIAAFLQRLTFELLNEPP